MNEDPCDACAELLLLARQVLLAGAVLLAYRLFKECFL